MPLLAPLQRAYHGEHFRALRLSGAANLIEPFLGVDHAWMSGPTFPLHPHAGLSALSYVFLDSETGLANHDSLGNNNVINPGGLHWMAATQRVTHEEVPAENDKTVHSLQIFVGIPDRLRGAQPFSLSLEPHEVPVVQMDSAKVRVVLGSFEGVQSPIEAPQQITMLDISLTSAGAIEIQLPAGECGFVMPIYGAVSIDDVTYGISDLRLPVYPAMSQSQNIKVRASNPGTKFMFFSGQPLQSF